MLFATVSPCCSASRRCRRTNCSAASGPRVIAPFAGPDAESAEIEINSEQDDQIVPGGPIVVHDLSTPRLLIAADALRKNLALARGEREVSKVFEVTEPSSLVGAITIKPARDAAHHRPGPARALPHLGSHRGQREADAVFCDHPQFERLYARLVDEYELKERAAMLAQKLRVIEETTRALTAIIDTERSARLEAIIVLVVF